MRFLEKHYDGGVESGVTGFYLIEIKSLFSIILLKFQPNHRENYHSHAFHALSWWIKGEAVESFPNKKSTTWRPSIIPKTTLKRNIHINTEKDENAKQND